MTPATPALRGLWCAILTPIDAGGSIDHARFAGHVQRLFANGVDGVVPFGTTGEGQSFSVDERRRGLEALVAAGVAPARILVATGAAAITDTLALTRHALSLDCTNTLLLPPFFFKGIGDAGVVQWFERVIGETADPRLGIYAYNIPQVSAVAVTPAALSAVAARFPGVIRGVKDSTGDWESTMAFRRGLPDLAVFCGHEPHVPQLLENGGAGTVCGLANQFPALMRRVVSQPAAAQTQDDIAKIRRLLVLFERYPVFAACKSLMAHLTGQPEWAALRPPIASLPAAEAARFLREVAGTGLNAGLDCWPGARPFPTA